MPPIGAEATLRLQLVELSDRGADVVLAHRRTMTAKMTMPRLRVPITTLERANRTRRLPAREARAAAHFNGPMAELRSE